MFERRLTQEVHRGGISSRWAFSWIAGVERNLHTKLRAGIAYMHQDFGARSAAELDIIAFDSPYKEGWAFLGNTSYSLLTLNYELSPLIKANVSGIFNLSDGSSLWQPKILISTSDNSDVTIFGWLPTGAAPNETMGRNFSRSEFGRFSKGGGLICRWFF